jgi:ATP-dependent RNA helicase RhlE
MLFEKLGLSAELLRAIDEQGYRQATPVQQQAIPLILEGRDILAGAQTGTGKTAGFTLPLLQQLQTRNSGGGRRRVKVLILTPTRELAAQVHQSVRDYGRHLPFKAMEIFGGVSINPQISKLRKGIDIVVATPGRLLDHVRQKTIDLSGVEILVLDEADRMLDMGFIRDMRKIFAVLPKHRQTLMFSATFSKEIRRLAADLLNAPVEIQVTPRNTTVEKVRQIVYPVDRRRKRELLSHRIGVENWRQVLVFTRTKHGANRLAEQLTSDGLKTVAIHGNKSQGARTKALADFKAGKVRVLVATDIAARGLDIDRLPHVVNFELPNVPEDYIHRIGRTARAGQDGHAISLVCIDEQKLLRDIERLLKCEIEKEIIPGYEPDPRIKAEPVKKGRSQRPNGRGNGSRKKAGTGTPKARRRPRSRSSGHQRHAV